MKATISHFSLGVLLITWGFGVISVQGADKVESYRGLIDLRQTQAGTIEIILEHEVQTGPVAGGPLRYVLQREVTGTDNDVVAAWKGKGRLFLAKGLVALVGVDGTQRMYKFAETAIPRSLLRFGFSPNIIYGIARYTDTTAVSAGQAVRSSNGVPGTLALRPLNVPACPDTCQSGGEGATNCALGSGGFTCSTTCGSGFHACCWYELPNQPACRCCKD